MTCAWNSNYFRRVGEGTFPSGELPGTKSWNNSWSMLNSPPQFIQMTRRNYDRIFNREVTWSGIKFRKISLIAGWRMHGGGVEMSSEKPAKGIGSLMCYYGLEIRSSKKTEWERREVGRCWRDYLVDRMDRSCLLIACGGWGLLGGIKDNTLDSDWS